MRSIGDPMPTEHVVLMGLNFETSVTTLVVTHFIPFTPLLVTPSSL